MGRDLGASESALQRIVSAYLLGFAATLIVAEQGVMAALLMPQVLGSLRTPFQVKERGAAFGMYGAVAGFASAIGLLLGGVLTDADLFGLGRRSVFLVNLPVAAATFVAGLFLVADRLAARFGRLVLVAGSLLMAGGFAWGWSAVAASSERHTGAWLLVPGLVVAGAGLGRHSSAAMPWVAAGFALWAVLCPALPRRAVTQSE
ncbi:hypothetical protein AB0O76_24580 [Streptomyces sp. NPDC086554]|uniref:hypothetical protein n=1 Tax=Streptomyces sp. NPDC086554 TaxID=3154864 RepID=UPI00341C8F9B